MANNETKANKEKGQYLALEQRDTDKKQSGEGDEDNLLNKDEEQHLREEREAEQELEQDTLEDEFDQKFWVDVRNLNYRIGMVTLIWFVSGKCRPACVQPILSAIWNQFLSGLSLLFAQNGFRKNS